MQGRQEKTNGQRVLRVILAGALLAAVASASAFYTPEAAGAEQRMDERVLRAHVVGGAAVPNGKYRFVAALLDVRRGNTPHFRRYCSGTLIDEDSVLTAAHCVDEKGLANDVPAAALRVTVGRTFINGNQGVVRRVSKISVHPNWREDLYSGHDVAVLTLQGRVPGIVPIKLATARQNHLERPGRKTTVAGWGHTKQRSPDTPLDQSCCWPKRMREARVPIVADAAARRVYGRDYKPALHIAAGAGGRSICQGDSGGPLFARAGRPPRATQIGITSYLRGCAAPGNPAVFTEVNSPSNRSFIVSASR